MTLTPSDIEEERTYRIAERLGLDESPPNEQSRLRAERRVEKDLVRLEFDDVLKGWKV